MARRIQSRMSEKSAGSAASPIGATDAMFYELKGRRPSTISAHLRMPPSPGHGVHCRATSAPRSAAGLRFPQGAPRRQQKMIRHLRSFHSRSRTRRAIPPARPMRASGRTRDRALRPRGPPRGLGGTRYRTMSRQSEMATSATMSATIMTQAFRLRGPTQLSRHGFVSRALFGSRFARPRRFRSRPILDSISWITPHADFAMLCPACDLPRSHRANGPARRTRSTGARFTNSARHIGILQKFQVWPVEPVLRIRCA